MILMHVFFDRWHFLNPGTKWMLLFMLLIIGLGSFIIYHMVSDQKSIRDIRCLALNIYHEARGESYEGRLAVATVTMNRMDSRRYPDNVCDVVRQYGWNPRLQRHVSAFSWTGDQLSDIPKNSKAWRDAVELTRQVLDGERHPQLGEALFYHADHIKPGWASRKTQIAKIGRHIFYP